MGVLRNIISTPCACNRCQSIQALIAISNLALIFEALGFLPPHRQKMLAYKMLGTAIWQKNKVCHMRFNTCHISQEMLISQLQVTAFTSNTKGQMCPWSDQPGNIPRWSKGKDDCYFYFFYGEWQIKQIWPEFLLKANLLTEKKFFI